MIKLKELLSLNELKYSDKIKEKHQEKMSRNNSILPNEMSIAKTPPPDNGSKQTLKELYWLLDYNDGKIDNDMIKEGDEVIDVFEKYCKENNLKFDRSYYKKVLKESAKIILKLKYHYNRPRPYQLAEFYGIPDFKIHKLDSAKTPSYPSGHTIQGHLLYLLLSKKYPNHYEELKKIADYVSNSRLMARAHFPSDVKFGEKVAENIMRSIND